MEFLSVFWGAFKFGALNMAWLFVALWGMERLHPKDRPPERVQLASLRFWVFYAVAGAAITAAYSMARPDIPPLISLPLALPNWLAYIVGPLALMAVYDFWNYWMHRAQHKWFWRQHSIHHSIRNLSAINSYMHWTEDFFRIAFISVPSAMLFQLEISGVTLVSTILAAAHGNFIHSASTINFGRIGSYLIADNRWHRIHHSIEAEHFDKNFATAFPLWDHIFGTAHVPARDEWPATGVHDAPEPRSIGDYLWRPFLSDNEPVNDRAENIG